jgi:HlyD family secretion protein
LQANTTTVRSRRQDIGKQIAAIKQQIITQEREKRRWENLVKSNAGNQKQLDDINSQIAYLQKQLIAQTSTLENNNAGVNGESSSLEIQVAQLNDQLSKCHIISPINGTVLSKYAEKGELATPGKALFKVADIENMFLRAYITSDQLSKIKIGQKVKVFADYGGENVKEFPGTVTWISNKSEFTPKGILTKDERANLVYAVKVAVKNSGDIKIGMYGEVSFTK